MAHDEEIQGNAVRFRDGIGDALSGNITTIVARDSEKLDAAYARLTTLQSWRSFILDEQISSEALGFFTEAQNDGLTSSVLVSSGLWRSSMKSLRSLIENLIQCLYFMDHPVEYRNWGTGKYRPTFSELFNYLGNHPSIRELPSNMDAVSELKSHYSHLSNVVHSSSLEFRMTTAADQLKLWKTAEADVGKWATTHKKVLRDANLILLALFNTSLQGAANKGLRESLAIVIPTSKDGDIKSVLGVKIPR